MGIRKTTKTEEQEVFITDAMVATFIREMGELGSQDAVYEKYGCCRCEYPTVHPKLLERYSPEELDLHARLHRKRMKTVLQYPDHKDQYYANYIAGTVWDDKGNNAFYDWRYPLAFFKMVHQRADDKLRRIEYAKKQEALHYEHLTEHRV